MSQSRLSPQARREQIIRAAADQITDHGLANLSLRDIAKHAGVSMGTVTYHFDSVVQILSAVVIEESARFYADVVRGADEEQDPWVALAMLSASLFSDAPEVKGHWRIWADYWATIARHPEMAETYSMDIRHWERCCERVIARGIAADVFRAVDPACTALKLAAYSDGLGTQLSQGVPGLTPARAREWMDEFMHTLLDPSRSH